MYLKKKIYSIHHLTTLVLISGFQIPYPERLRKKAQLGEICLVCVSTKACCKQHKAETLEHNGVESHKR